MNHSELLSQIPTEISPSERRDMVEKAVELGRTTERPARYWLELFVQGYMAGGDWRNAYSPVVLRGPILKEVKEGG